MYFIDMCFVYFCSYRKILDKFPLITKLKDMKDRLMKIITSEGLTPSLLADEMGVQRSGISHILSGRNNPSYDFLQKLLARFPKLNAEWIITGQGPMYKPSHTTSPDLFPLSTLYEKIPIPPDISKNPQHLSSGEGNKTIAPEQTMDTLPSGRTKKIIERMIAFYTDKTFSVYLPE